MRGLALCSLLLVATTAFAQRDNAHTQREIARAHFEKAKGHFAVGEFEQAAAEYQLAYKAKNDPALLYNAAQAFRLANKLDKALILYKNYVQLYPRERNVEEVRGQIAKLKDAIAAAESAKNAPPTAPVEPTHPPPTEPVQPAAPETKQVAAKKDGPTPIYKKWWLWTIVGVVVAGGVVTAAVVTTVPSGTWPPSPITVWSLLWSVVEIVSCALSTVKCSTELVAPR